MPLKRSTANWEPEVPSNILLKSFTRPSYYLGILIVSWGIIMTLTGVVQNFGGLLAVRILLGTFEYIIPARRI
jgi:type IV secretory pathway VirB3-like protein